METKKTFLFLICLIILFNNTACKKIAPNTPACIEEKIKSMECLSKVDEYSYLGESIYYFTGDFRGDASSCYGIGCSFAKNGSCNNVIDAKGKIICECPGPGGTEPNNCIDFKKYAVFVRKIYLAWY